MNTKAKKQMLDIDDCWNHIGVWGSESSRCEKLKEVMHCRNCDKFSSSGQQVLEQPLSEEYLKDWAETYSHKKEKHLAGTSSSLVFRLGDEFYSFPSNTIVEVTEIRTIHSIPHSKSKSLQGLVNIRGELKICISIRNLLGVNKDKKQSAEANKNISYERMIVVKDDEQQFVFPVSEVIGSFRYNDEKIKAPPATVSNTKDSFTIAVLNVDQKHIACLDLSLISKSIKRNIT